jgi:dihydroorotate dehydrogenase
MYKKVIRPILFKYEAEKAHDFVMNCMQYGWWLLPYRGRPNKRLQQTVLGATFQSPILNASGFDKRGLVSKAIRAMGAGGCMVGTVVQHAQPGNEKPRMFRLPEEEAIKNRMGLNSYGAQDVYRNVSKFHRKYPLFPIGISIGYNSDVKKVSSIFKDQEGIAQTFEELMTFAVLNDSCPNIAKSGDKKTSEFLSQSCQNLRQATSKPLLLKIAPNLSKAEIQQKCDIARKAGFVGMVACNTYPSTVSDVHPDPDKAKDPCGKSGPFLFDDSIRTIKVIRAYWQDAIIIGVGGINCADRAIQMLQAGATLIKIYTALVYEGPSLMNQIHKGIIAYLKENNLENVSKIHSHYLNTQQKGG